MTAKEPLSYEPAGSGDVTLPLVPTVIDAEALGVDPPAEHPASARAAIALPPRTASDRVPNEDADVISVAPFDWKRPWRTRVETTDVGAVQPLRTTRGLSTTSRGPQSVEYLFICNTRPLCGRSELFAAEGSAFGFDAHQLDLQCAVFLGLGGGIRPLGLTEQVGLTPQ